MNAIIVDDEADARSLLKGDLESYCSSINIVGEADGVESAKKLIDSIALKTLT